MDVGGPSATAANNPRAQDAASHCPSQQGPSVSTFPMEEAGHDLRRDQIFSLLLSSG